MVKARWRMYNMIPLLLNQKIHNISPMKRSLNNAPLINEIMTVQNRIERFTHFKQKAKRKMVYLRDSLVDALD